MRKDYILTAEQKQSKKRRLEENRLLRVTSVNHVKIENTNEPIINHESVRENSISLCFQNM